MQLGSIAKADIAILGAGFIGKNLLNLYVAKDCAIRALDQHACPEEYESKVDWRQGSFMNSCDVAGAVKNASVVFHFISSTVPGDSVDENEELFSNVIQTINLLNICVRENVGRVVFISSASVYGIQAHIPIAEEACTNPISSHGVHKLTIEKYLSLFKYEHGLDSKIMRLSNPYGYGQNIYGRQGIFAIAIGKMLSGGEVTIMGDGSAVRDFVNIKDVANALCLMAETKSDEYVFNIGTGKGVCIKEAVAMIEECAARKLSVIYGKCRKSDIPWSVLNISKAETVLGYEPEISLNDGIRELLEFYGIK